ncbi:MAG: hypothetical protein ACI4AH_01340 [Muribaculaceae bacterium]
MPCVGAYSDTPGDRSVGTDGAGGVVGDLVGDSGVLRYAPTGKHIVGGVGNGKPR